MNEYVVSARALGPQIRASDLFEQSWRYTDTRNDPRLAEPCLIYDTVSVTWWEGPGEGHSQSEDGAVQWIPRMWFEDGYGSVSRERSIFCFLEPELPGNYPNAWKVFDNAREARDFLTDNPKLKFLSRGSTNGRYAMRGYIDGVGPTATHVRNHAGLFDAAEINHVKFDIGLSFEVLPEDYVPPPKPKITIRHILTPKMIETLQVMPDNPIVRTQVWSLIKAQIPEDKKTFEEIKTWIEENYDPKFAGSFKEPPLDDPFAGFVMPGLVAPRLEMDDHGFYADVSTSRRVHGRCNYSAIETGSSSYHITASMIERAARMARENLDPNGEFQDKLSETIGRIVRDNPPDDTEEQERETYDHEQNDHEALNVSFHRRVFDHALQWLRRYHPDLAEVISPGGMEDEGPEEEEDEDPDNDPN